MKQKSILSVLILLISLSSFAQKGQRIAFVDMNYILENIPAYTRAQTQLNKKVQIWQQDLDKLQGEITTMQTDLSNEKALLTDDLVAEKEEDILIKQFEFKKMEESYFSSEGNLFLLRKQLVTPIQDQVYNAAQEIAKARRYDYVFDKSSDLIMLYSNKSNDISELVLRSIVRGEKATKSANKRAAANQPKTKNKSTTTNTNATPVVGVNSNATTKQSEEINSDSEEVPVIDEREAKRAAALAKIEEQKKARAKKREDQKAAIEKKRVERLKQREDVRKELENNKNKKTEDKKAATKDEKEDDQKENNN